jgi:hypothetical protein
MLKTSLNLDFKPLEFKGFKKQVDLNSILSTYAIENL